MAGKGDRPRNCFSKNYKDNYDAIAWGHFECSACGYWIPKSYLKEFPEKYVIHQDGSIEHKECNYN